MRRKRVLVNLAPALMLCLGMVLLAGCSTVTPYQLDMAQESLQFGAIDKFEAVQILKTQMRVSGEIADYRSFLIDEDGFSYTKTTEETKTEWKKGEPREYAVTRTLTRNVPWSAVTGLTPYCEEYKIKLFGSAYRVQVDFNIVNVKYGTRMKEREHIEMTCKTREDLADVLAALRVLTGR